MTIFYLVSENKALHLELGSGIAKAGETLFRGNNCIFDNSCESNCILSDIDANILNKSEMKKIDATEEIPYQDDSFHLIIACNPYNYGFHRSRRYGEKNQFLLREIDRLLKDKGYFILIGSKRNPFVNLETIENLLPSFSLRIDLDKSIIDDRERFSKMHNNFTFYMEDEGQIRPTIPDMQLVIKKC